MYKKFTHLSLVLIALLLLSTKAFSQCGLLVDIEPIPRANICLGESVDLLAKTNLTTPIPTVCGLNADRTCGPGADSVDATIGAGTIVNTYNSSAPELFGDFGEAQTRSQLIFLASELKATGFNGGKITSLALDIAALSAGKNHTITNLSIKMACTSASNFSNAFFSGLDQVYNPKTVTLVAGMMVFSFDQAFDWDGQSNILIEFCAYSPAGTSAGTVNWGNFTRDNVPGFASWRQVGNATSNGDCISGGTERNFNQRPNIKFNICRPKVVNLTYDWTPKDGSLTPTTGSRVVASTSVNTRYYVKVTKTGDPTCFNTDSIDITVEDPSLFTPTSNSPLCAGSTLQFNANTTGVTYFWSGPNGFSSFDQNPTITNVTTAASGTYTFLIDKGFCKATKTIVVDIQPIPKTGIGKDSTICRSITNLNLFGLLTGEDPGGVWSDDNASGILTGGSINPSLLNNNAVPATFKYTYTITNICGTLSTSINVSVIATKSAGIDDDTTICETGSPINLLTVLDGNPNSGGTFTDNNSSGQLSGMMFNPDNLGPATFLFTYTVAGTSPCPNTTSKVTVTVADQPDAGNNNVASICTNAGINLFNQILGTPKPGGTWTDMNNSGGILNASTGAYTASGVAPGIYMFKYKVNAVAPCLADSTTITLTVKGPPIIANVTSLCSFDKSTYTVSFELSGGDPATYSVSPAGGTFAGTGPKVYTSAPVPDATTITFTATDVNGCGSSTTTVLKRCACPTQAGTVQTSPSIQVCNSNSGTAIYNGGYASDGNDTLNYVLHTSAGVTLGTVITQQTSPSFTYQAGMNYGQTYYISVVAGNKLANNLVDLTDQCLSVSQGVPVVFGLVAVPSFTFSANPACPGDNLTLTSSVSGTPSYSWSGPNNFFSTQQNPTINNIPETAAGNYILTVTSNGCTLSTTRTLTIVNKPGIVLEADTEICAGNSGNLYFTITGPAPILVTYGVNPGTPIQVLMNPGLNTIPISPSVNTTYTLIFANYPGGGCQYTLSGSVTVKVVPVPSATYSVVGENAFCFNESNIGKIAFQLKTGVTANLTYSLDGIVQPVVTGVTDGFQINVPATNPGATVFDVTSLSLSNGTCVFQNTNPPITFYNLIDPIVTATIDKTVLCSNDSVKVDFSVVASEQVIIDYNVGGAAKTLVTSKDTTIYIPITGTTFINIQRASYQLKTSCTRSISQFFSITANQIPVVAVDVTNTACNNTNTGAINVASQSPTDVFSLDGSPFGAAGNFSGLFSGVHTLIVRGANGCEVRKDVEIIAASNLTVLIDAVSTACGYDNGSVTLSAINGKAPYTILFDGTTVGAGTVTGLKAGTYPVLVIDANNCIKPFEVTIDPSIPIVVTTTDNGLVDCTAPEYSAVFVSATGGTGTYTYSVPGQPVQTDSVFHGLYPQTYVITVMDDRGCITTKQIKLNSIQKFNITPLVRKPLLCFESTDAEIQVNTSNAFSDLLFATNTNPYQTDNIFRNIGPGNLTVTVRENGGCNREQSVSFGVTRPDPIKLSIVSSGQPSCFNTTDGFIILNATGGSLQNKTYTVDGTDYRVNPNFNTLLKGNYTLIASDANGCHSDTINYFLDGPADIVMSTSFTFNGAQTLAELTINASGGNPGYFYSSNGSSYFQNNIFSNLQPGTYMACVKDSKNCTVCQSVWISGVGITETELDRSVMLFPNPFNEDFSITSDMLITNVTVRILNAIGEVVYENAVQEISKSEVIVKPASPLAPGVYFLELHSDQGTTIKKLIRQ